MDHSDKYNEFLQPELTSVNVDRWYVRRSILDAIVHHQANFYGKFLDIGCGTMPYQPLLSGAQSKISQYIGLDIPNEIYKPPNLYWNGIKIPLGDGTVDSAMATEVLEHCPRPEIVLSEIFRVLKPGGAFFFTVPFLWPLHDIPYDEFRYTPFALERILNDVGFSDISLSALGGWDASLAQMIGLWTRRRPMKSRDRKILSTLAIPIIRLLARRDIKPSKFSESTMITGLAGIAHKSEVGFSNSLSNG